MQIDELEMIMAVEHLPRVRELSGLASHMVMLRSIGALLRVQYNDLLHEHVPDHLAGIVRQLRASG